MRHPYIPGKSIMDQDFRTLAVIAASGAVVGVGQLLNSAEPVTLRKAIGRAIVSCAIAVSASASLVWFPNMPFVAQIGLACTFASLGTSFLEKMAQRFIGSK